MTVDPETLAAYAEGHLGADDAAAIEAAINADPALARQVEAHRALKAQLLGHFAPVMAAPVPERLLLALQTPQDAEVLDFAAAQKARADRTTAATNARCGFLANRWAVGGALAASLVLGLFVGGRINPPQMMEVDQGRLVARAGLEDALSQQLSGADGGQPVRVLLSMKDASGHYCRAFDAGSLAGIACREGDGWTIRRADGATGAEGASEYRQAGSADAAIMAAAQGMASGDALDADQERAARDSGWK